MSDIYEGDPKLILGQNGSRFAYSGGQPLMDRGVENSISIDLGTKSRGENSHQNGWIGNHLMRDPAQRIGTDYQETVENIPITLAGLATAEQATKKALSGKLYGTVESYVTNPSTDKRLNEITVNPPTGAFKFYTEFSQLWQFQSQLQPEDEPESEPLPVAKVFNVLGSDNFLILGSDGYIIQSFEGTS